MIKPRRLDPVPRALIETHCWGQDMGKISHTKKKFEKAWTEIEYTGFEFCQHIEPFEWIRQTECHIRPWHFMCLIFCRHWYNGYLWSKVHFLDMKMPVLCVESTHLRQLDEHLTLKLHWRKEKCVICFGIREHIPSSLTKIQCVSRLSLKLEIVLSTLLANPPRKPFSAWLAMKIWTESEKLGACTLVRIIAFSQTGMSTFPRNFKRSWLIYFLLHYIIIAIIEAIAPWLNSWPFFSPQRWF